VKGVNVSERASPIKKLKSTPGGGKRRQRSHSGKKTQPSPHGQGSHEQKNSRLNRETGKRRESSRRPKRTAEERQSIMTCRKRSLDQGLVNEKEPEDRHHSEKGKHAHHYERSQGSRTKEKKKLVCTHTEIERSSCSTKNRLKKKSEAPISSPIKMQQRIYGLEVHRIEGRKRAVSRHEPRRSLLNYEVRLARNCPVFKDL